MQMFVKKKIQLYMAKTNDNINWITIIQWKLKAVKLKKHKKKFELVNSIHIT